MTESILVDESVFDETFVPEKLIGRKGQMEEIAGCLKPAKVGKSIKNLYIYGPPGAGKSLITRWILKEHFGKISVYVNCWRNTTSHKIVSEIMSQLGYVVHGKESTAELLKRLEKSGKRLIICLDESDHIKETDILYDLARSSYGMVLISNHVFSLSKIDNRIKSGLFLQEVEFKPYNRDEILEILKERISFGLRPYSINPRLLSIIAGISNGDARVGLQTLKISAKDAESKDLNAITMEEIKTAAKCARKYRLSYLLDNLNEHQKVLYEILKKAGKMSSGQLFAEYKRTSRQSLIDRSYRNYMQRMEELGLVREHGSRRWKEYEVIF